MRRPPLLSFLTFNRLGNTAVSLPSLLRTEDDFELMLVDNGSRDDTWEFLNDTRDPRIKYRHRFDENIGVVHALNYCLSHRGEDQDWINYEYDFHIHDKKFITSFREVYKEFPEMGVISASVYPRMIKEIFPEEIEKDPGRVMERNGKRIYKDYIMGFCSFAPYEAMNQLMYYDEVDAFADLELNLRIRSIDKITGYAMDIQCSHTTDGGDCDTCLAYHSYCTGYNEKREPHCMKYYKRIVSQVTEEIKMWSQYAILRQNADDMAIFPESEKNSIFSGKAMDPADEAISKHIMELFKRFSKAAAEDVDNG